MKQKNSISVIADQRELVVEEGTTVLKACLDNGIYIPNLCYLPDMEAPATSCRMCFVEIAGTEYPVPSCSIRVKEGMVINTDTPRVRQLQRTGLQLLLSVHHVECAHCPANKQCELQRIAKFLHIGLKPKYLENHLKAQEVMQEHPFIDYYPNRCVLCGKCVHTCKRTHGLALLTFAQRGLNTVISFFGNKTQDQSSCESCKTCIDVCPVRALVINENRSSQLR